MNAKQCDRCKKFTVGETPFATFDFRSVDPKMNWRYRESTQANSTVSDICDGCATQLVEWWTSNDDRA